MLEPHGLTPHPEGGWFRDTWRSPVTVKTPRGARPSATAIQFLLQPGQRSDWHRVHGSGELWLWQEGGPLRLRLGGTRRRPALHPREFLLRAGGSYLVQPGEWQSPEAVDGPVLATRVLSPGFDPADVQLGVPAPPTPTLDLAAPAATPGPVSEPAVRVLLLCQGNLCRSPMAQLLLRSELALRGLDSVVAVDSAGLGTHSDRPIEPLTAKALARFRVDGLAEFRTRSFSSDMDADVVLTATTALRDDAIHRAPGLRGRAFTWRELLAYDADAPGAPVEGDTPQERVERWVADLRTRRGLVHSDARGGFDVTDPMGKSPRVFERVADDIAVSMRALADALERVVAPPRAPSR